MDARFDEMQQQLRLLLDEREILQVLQRYCRGVDRCDAALIDSCYHEDAVDDHGNWQASGRTASHEIIRRVRPGPELAMHFLGNVLIEVDGGDTAFAESYLLAFRTASEEGKTSTRTRAVRFVDRFERRAGAWRISERVVVDDWNRIDEVVGTMADTPLFRRSAKDTTDPVYRIRQGRVAR